MASGPRRSPPWVRNFAYKAAYLLGNIVFISILYGAKASILYEARGAGDDSEPEVERGIELGLWTAILASWVAYLLVQGSEPGFVAPGSAQPPGREGVGPAGIDLEEAGGADAAATGAPRAGVRPATSDAAGLLRPDEDEYEPDAAADPVSERRAAADAARAGHRECARCHAEQPARAHHCRECDRCVALFDHHCGVLNTCIGERNRARFWLFLATQSYALAWAIGLLNTSFVWRRAMSDWVAANVMAILALVVLWVLQIFVFGLFVFHTWLAATNTTTYETSRGGGKLWYLAGTDAHDCDLPYSRGLCGNLRLFFCGLDTWCGVGVALRRRREGGGGSGSGWAPRAWAFPGAIDRESTDVCANLWENKYWSCC